MFYICNKNQSIMTQLIAEVENVELLSDLRQVTNEILKEVLGKSVQEALTMDKEGKRCSTRAVMEKLDKEMQWK